MPSPDASDRVTTVVHLEDLFIWFAALREAPDEVPREQFTAQIGADWTECDRLGQEVRAARPGATEDGNVELALSVAELNVIRRCLIASLEGLGIEEFHTRVGRDLVEGYLALRRLNELTSNRSTGTFPSAEQDARQHAETIRATPRENPWTRQEGQEAPTPSSTPPGRRLTVAKEPTPVAAAPDELFIWFAAIRQATEELHPEVFAAQIGVDWETCEALGGRLLEHRTRNSDTTPVPLTATELDAIRRCLLVAIERHNQFADRPRVDYRSELQAAARKLEAHTS